MDVHERNVVVKNMHTHKLMMMMMIIQPFSLTIKSTKLDHYQLACMNVVLIVGRNLEKRDATCCL